MTEPTGYTALDLVGFTDKGTYNAATAYVKNDLVHYSGDIWRCLIDDTTNITPVEGTNWTVFIEAPTNAIEGIIAPVETNPATNSYAVGRQFIYNDNLYIVLTAITAGDTLVAYEDDPSNANIQLADPVETQLLDFEEKAYSTDDSAETTLASDDLVPFYDTSAAAKRQMTVANMIGQTVSNPNLLDNPWFTVNQRGETSLSASGAELFVDRWKARQLTAELVTNGLKLTRTGEEATAFGFFFQNFLVSEVKHLLGKTLTVTVNIKSLNITQGYLRITVYNPNSTTTSNTAIATSENITEAGIHSFTFTMPDSLTNDYLQFAFNFNSSDQSTISSIATIIVESIKVEVGSVSTLAMDAPPNYATELLKCQRYFYRLGVDDDSTVLVIGSGHCYGVYLMFNMYLPVSMRTAPALTVSGGISNCRINVNGSAKAFTSFSGIKMSNNNITMRANTSADMSLNSYPGDVMIKAESDSTLYLEFSADL